MIKTVLILGLAAIASAQVLRISPVVIGSGSPGQQQVIQLAAGGGLSSYKAQPKVYQPSTVSVAPVAAAPVSASYVQPVAVQQVRPIAVVAQPVVASYQPAPVVQVAPVRVAQAVPYQAAPARYETEERYQPQPYSFQFDSEDEYQTKIGRQESADQSGIITGSYTLSSADGIARIVNYVAHPVDGFSATVQTNEPGTLTSNPANVQIQSSAQAPSRR